MKSVLLALGLALVAGEAYAISRYNSAGMSCAEVKAVIQRDGAAIVRYRSARTGAQLYGRYVRDSRFCATSELPQIVYITSADSRQCLVRECRYYDPDDEFLLFGR
ncbi:hypothetical protein [Kumtagia ephedrae]|jgi:hypothetical protein|uniref:KTSC domain-containing protein n=1 Tax=Kumtagia ephedrae TaxID=2116701 RepID=A0A2P7SDD4_9HYPH|nr:hypothetical protein [Mesorhizobium ephedrae]PSJ60522.1 hypothetical protein C7I84_11125 [Mesorhizobium ephedrae]